MSRRPERHYFLSELRELEIDPTLLDLSADSCDVDPPRHEDGDGHEQGPGFRSLLEHPEALSDAWWPDRERRGERSKRRRHEPSAS